MRLMGRTTYLLSLLFLLLVVLLEVWVFYMETNRRVRALRIHVFVVQELAVSAAVWYIWKRITYTFKSGNAFSVNTAVRVGCSLILGFSQAAIVVGLVFVGREPAYVTRISNTCLGIVIFVSTSLLMTDIVAFSLRKILSCASSKFTGKEGLSVKTEIKWRTLVALALAVGLSFAGVVGVSQLCAEKLTVPIQGLNPGLNGTTIVQLSDVHLGGYNGRSTMRRIVDDVNRLDADMVVITGDLVDGAVEYLKEVVEPLRDLKTKHGVFFATGNHEYYTADVDNWITELPKLGVTPLVNSRVCFLVGETVSVKRGGGGEECEGGLYLAGLEDITTRMGIYGDHSMDLAAALGDRTRGTPTVVLAHQPRAAMEAIEWNDMRLVLSGHTHAGQFFPLSVFVYFLNPLYVGLYEPRPGVYVYVSPGTVYYVIPFRHYRPEITKFTLLSV